MGQISACNLSGRSLVAGGSSALARSAKSARYDPVMSLGAGEQVAGYSIVRPLGAGGMGEVYLARHPRLPRQDALKLLNASISSDRNFRKRFLREADLAARLWHPHIVGVHDRGEDDGRLWIAMDFVDGTDAAELMSRKFPAGMPQDLVIAVVNAVASALDYSHSQGLLHRDVKPANIMITSLDDEEQRRILLTDFGIAREIEDASGLTQTNMTLGTVAYAAPEQLMGEEIDGRADQYALAASAYHLLTGAPPFPQSSPAAVIGQHLNGDPPRLSATRPDLASLDEVLARALAKKPGERFPRCADFARALTDAVGDNAATPQAPTMEALVTPPPGPGEPRYAEPRCEAMVGTTPSRATPFRPATLLAGVAIALAVLTVGALIGLWSRGGGSSTTASPSPTIEPPATPSSVLVPSTVTVSVAPPPTVTKTVIPTASPTRPLTAGPVETGWGAIIVDTCDEGGSCGVQQRTGPFNAAPKMYPDVLQDGSSVTVTCQAIGDVRSSAGHGASRAWFRLQNGAYINSVYTTLPPAGIPSC